MPTIQRVIRKVDISDWQIASLPNARIARLHSELEPVTLLANFISEAAKAENNKKILLDWQESMDSPGFGRVIAQIPISEMTFDQLFNGRSGYRAQYYLSPEEGILFNRDIIIGLNNIIKNTYHRFPLSVSIDLVQKSILAPHSKIWIFNEKEAFDTADDGILNPPRWIKNKAVRGRKAPLPAHHTIDLMGTFLHPKTFEIFIDELKIDRAWDIFNKGYT